LKSNYYSKNPIKINRIKSINTILDILFKRVNNEVFQMNRIYTILALPYFENLLIIMKPKTPLSIIIADDHPSVRYGIRSILEDLDFISCIDGASNGSEVLTLLEEKPYDIVLMDIVMPGKDGLETTVIIKQKYPNVKIIMLSMHTEERYVIEMIAKGALGYLIKNADRDVIIEAIESVLEGNIYISKEISYSTFNNVVDHSKPGTKRNTLHDETLREIIFLLCLEFGSKQIADILCFSKRTVDKYRDHISDRIGTKNLAGIIKYAIEHGINEDVVLKNKFAKYLIES
jgi:DNA-binding NarL/FixJ family response regulator